MLAACGATGSPGEEDAPERAPSALASIASLLSSATASPASAAASSAPIVSAPTATAPAPTCDATLEVARGDSFEQIARRCYGSRAYADWVAAHANLGRGLQAGDKLELPSFETLVTERLAAKWRSEAPSIAEAYSEFRGAEPEIDAQLGGAAPGMAAYHPSPAAAAALERAAKAAAATATRLEAAGVHTKKFKQAAETLHRMANGAGNLSTDYATEEVHQSFYYGVEALH